MQALHCRTLFDGVRMRHDARLVLDGPRVAAVEEGVGPRAGDRRLPDDLVVAPGLVDIQVNGGGGVLLNDAPTVDTIATIAAAHARCGTTALLPTLITDLRDTVDAAVAAARSACASVPGVLGLHLEGPFLDPGRRGVHRADRIAEFDPATDLARLAALGSAGRTLVTLAPERVPAGTVAALRERGVLVFAGHTAASFEAVRQALGEGLAGFTHLFNAMPPLSARAPGPLAAALLDRAAWAGLVLDGHHVAPACVALLRAARGLERVLLVSDAMPPAGTDARDFVLQGRRVRVEGGRCVAEDGTLAGAAITLSDSVRLAIATYGFSPEEALACAGRLPAELLGRADLGVLRPGAAADAVCFDAGWRPAGVLQGGRWCVDPGATP